MVLVFIGTIALFGYALNTVNEEQGALADANEYLASHNMVQALPSLCVRRGCTPVAAPRR